MYATVEDLRAEGVTKESAERLSTLIEEAGSTIDSVTGWHFDPRPKGYAVNGRGTKSLELPVSPVSIERVVCGTYELEDGDFVVSGAPVGPSFDDARIILVNGWHFPKGHSNVLITGRWGYTEDDGSVEGRTPLEIRRACMLLVLRWLPRLGDVDASGEARNRWRVVEERTRDQSYKLEPSSEGNMTGDPEVDSILRRYRKPSGMGGV